MSWSLIRDDGRVVSVGGNTPRCRTCGAAADDGYPCTACGRTNPKLFSYCGFCSHRLPTAGSSSPRMLCEPDEVTVVDRVRADMTWAGKPTKSRPRREAEETLDGPLEPGRPAASEEVHTPHPSEAPRGLVVVVLGEHASAEPIDAYVLEFGEIFDVDGPGLHAPAMFTALRHGLRLDDPGGLENLFVEVRGLSRLRAGQRFRVGELELRYESTSGLMPGVGHPARAWGRLVVLDAEGRVRGTHPVSALGCGLSLRGRALELSADIDAAGGACRIVGDLTGVYIESLDPNVAVFKEVQPKDVIALGSVALIENTRVRIEPAEL